VTLPVVLLLLDHWPLNRAGLIPHLPVRGPRRSPGQLLLEKAPLFAASLVAAAVAVLAQAHSASVTPLSSLPLPARVAHALVSAMGYLGKAAWPADLAFFYPHPGAPPAWLALVAGCGVVGLLAVAASALRSRPWLTLGILWYLVTLLPVAGLVQVGRQGMADRYTYLPLVGIGIALVWQLPAPRSRRGRALAAVLAVAVLAALAVRSHAQAATWSDSIQLCRQALRATRDNHLVHGFLARLLMERGDYAGGAEHALQALEIRPDQVEPLALLGNAAYGQGRYADAEALYRQFLRLRPALARRDAWVLHNLALALQRQGRAEQALPLLRAAARLDPQLPGASGDAAGPAGTLEGPAPPEAADSL
jgi:tetratricopeptide (TPR) repeat protein